MRASWSLAAGYETAGQFPRAARSYFRVLVAAVASEDKVAMADISENMIRVQLAMNDRGKALNYLNGAMRFAQELGDAARFKRLKDLSQALGRLTPNRSGE